MGTPLPPIISSVLHTVSLAWDQQPHSYNIRYITGRSTVEGQLHTGIFRITIDVTMATNVAVTYI